MKNPPNYELPNATPDAKTYRIEVQTYGSASIRVKANSAAEALAWASAKAEEEGEMIDEEIVCDWPTAEVKEES